LCAPLASEVIISDYEQGNGNYGSHVLLKHDLEGCETIYSLYGHLDRQRLPETGTLLSPGEPFAYIGDFHDNGNWFHHTHQQIITQKGMDNGFVSRGYCSADDIATIDQYCPSPFPLFVV
jgi:hypothetical protein